MIQRALISVSDKTGIVELAQALHQSGADILSTGGTAAVLRNSGIPVISISDVTDYPEMMDGRVKTLHPKIHGALLARRNNPEHIAQARMHDIHFIDLLVVNLYPFEQTIRKPDNTLDEAIENIDIGGPSMIRSAAKNFYDVCTVTDPADYAMIIDHAAARKDIPGDIRYELMIKAFEHTARYDRVISRYFRSLKETPAGYFPGRLELDLTKHQSLRYGENPHQSAAFYLETNRPDMLYRQLHGKELSYNNLLDADACARITAEFDKPACVIVKHNNPCGAALGEDFCEAYAGARSTDPQAAFGGIIGFNGILDPETANELKDVFTEVILAEGYEPEALDILGKKKNLRLLELDFRRFSQRLRQDFEIRRALNGYLVQTTDGTDDTAFPNGMSVISERKPTDEEMSAMLFGWKIVRHVKSNAIVLSRPEQTIGIGAGQMSRIDSVRLAVEKARQAGLDVRGTALASDAFFPFRDNIDEAAKAGVTAVIQPGGSVQDAEVLAAVNGHGMAMVITGIRHFRH